MDTLRSQSGPSSDDSYEDDEMKDAGTLSEPSSHLDPDKNPNQDPDQDRDEEPDKVPDKESSPSATNSVTSTIKSPVKKRRRVTRACDECRRKKIKCDGTQPCIHCTVYSYDCTYDKPSNRRRNIVPQYVEELENRLRRVIKALKRKDPDFQEDNFEFDAHGSQPAYAPIKPETPPGEIKSPTHSMEMPTPNGGRGTDALLESMVKNTGSLDLDDEGHWDFHGHSSGIVFLRRMGEQFGDLMSQSDGAGTEFLSTRRHSLSFESPRSIEDAPPDSISPNVGDLPDINSARKLCGNALSDACALVRFVHQPSFYRMLNRVYLVSPENFGNEENRFLALLYATLALGCLFAKQEESQLQINGYEGAIDQGFQYFKVSRQLVEITDCRDLTSLQAMLFMIMFLQSSARLSTCYIHIGTALRSAIRLGLHRSVPNDFDPIEREVRKRVFWVIRKMDTYVGAMLGFPRMLSDDDIDQGLPLEVDDEFIMADGVFPMPLGRVSVMAAFNAHVRLVEIVAKTGRYVYPIKGLTQVHNKSNQSYVVKHAQICEIEEDLQRWLEGLPMALKPGGEATPELARIQQLLRIAYAHAQIFLYRPFLHHISSDLKAEDVNKRTYACAAACVSVSRNIIHITTEMKRRGLLVGAYWFYMYTTFFAIISLVFFVLENRQSPATKATLRDAYEGRDTLASFAKGSLAADRCTKTLAGLFEQLPEKLKAFGIQTPPLRRRQSSSRRTLTPTKLTKSAPDLSAQMQLQKGASSQTRNSKPSPNPASRQEKHASLPHDSSTIRHKVVSELETDIRSTTIDSYSPDSMGLPTPENTNFHTTPNATHPLPGPLPDLSATMFPSADPWAYPNQPTIAPENNYMIKQEDGFNPNVYSANPSVPSRLYDNQIFITPPPYSMTGQQHVGTAIQAMGSAVVGTIVGIDDNNNNNVIMTNDMGGGWPQQQQQTEEVPVMNFGHMMFGQDWTAGWPDQSYRQ